MIDSTNPRIMADNIRALSNNSGGSTVIPNPEGEASGSLTSLGIDGTKYLIPTLEYSLTEKVVGKWIDGKTLYQKVIDYTVNKSASATLNFSDGNVKRVVDGFIINALNSICFPVNCIWEGKSEEFLYDETHFYVKTSANIGDNSTLRLIVQYTKTESNSTKRTTKK